MILFGGLLLATAVSAAPAKAPAVLATVNGVAIRRTEMMDRAWREYGRAVLNERVDEILTTQAAAGLGVKPDAQEVEARLKRIQSQFPDEAAFSARLAADGTNLQGLRSQIETQNLRENLVAKAKNIQVTDAEVKGFFDANKERLASPEAVHLRNVQVNTEKEANDFLAAIKTGADFAKLASQVSLDNTTKGRGGDVGFVPRGTLLPEIEKAAFALKPGEVAGPVKTKFGYHVLKAEESRPAKPAVFEEIKVDLRRTMTADKITKAWPDYLQELRAKATIVLGK
ncbi:MAG: peptidyl-prolyl cis-trans isomerase [Elusimicrobia bacterium]|nr:peptidyl-prolyl cis-trans isomerase [Elusimicrobiota bacterium]